MSLRPQPVPPIPAETARVARAAFPRGNLYLLLRDELGALAADEDLAPPFPTRWQPAEAPWRLTLVTIFQFIEGLSDRAAAEAVRSRLDWKYILSLELTDPGFDSSVLCEFRARLLGGNAESLLFDKLLDVCRERKWLKRRGRQRTDSTHVLAAVHAANRLQRAIETLRHALNALAVPPLSGCGRMPGRNGRSAMRRAPSTTSSHRGGKSGRLTPSWLGLTATTPA
jgi:transposase